MNQLVGQREQLEGAHRQVRARMDRGRGRGGQGERDGGGYEGGLATTTAMVVDDIDSLP